MNALEQRTFTDGFYILLLRLHVDVRRNMAAFRARLFDGGRAVAELANQQPY